MYGLLSTVASVKAWRDSSKGTVTTADDAQILSILTRVSELIGRYCSRSNLGSIETYTELRFIKQSRMFSTLEWTLVLKRYPVTTLTSVSLNGTVLPILTPAQLIANGAGVFLDTNEDEPRTLHFLGVQAMPPGVAQIAYSAGYSPSAIPGGLQQAADQYCVEIMRSANSVMLTSNALQGETTSYDKGDLDWGMSNRTKAMLKPYKDVAGWGL